jgi:hypothetical protein
MNISRDRLKNPLIRDGVSQRQRQDSALSPDSIKVDERELSDALVLAHALSEKVAYYNQNNTQEGTWQDFFASSPLVQLALISKTRPQVAKDKYTESLQAFLSDRTPATLLKVLDSWKTNILGVVESDDKTTSQACSNATSKNSEESCKNQSSIADWYGQVRSYAPFRDVIQGLVKTNLRQPLNRMQAIELAYQPEATAFYTNFARTFGLTLESTLTPDRSPLQNLPDDARDDLDSIFQMLFQTYRQIIQQASAALLSCLKDQQDHPPALALYVAFWYVMQAARDDLNRMTQRHLDFFYRQVLQLKDRPAQPDSAHLVFELAKGQTEHKLATGTRFKAGKDASGKALIYQLDQDIVVHKAQIASLKGLFLDLGTSAERPILGVHVSPQANSFDGKGGEFPKDQTVKAWLPFGNKKRDHASLGLAIASKVFLLQEGKRTIVFQFTLSGVKSLPAGLKLNDASENKSVFKVSFSGEKDWIAGKILDEAVAISGENFTTGWQGNILTLVVELSAGDEAIVSYHNKLKGAALTTYDSLTETVTPVNQPVAQILIDDTALIDSNSPYHYFRDATLTDLTIQVHVDEVRNLVIQNDLSTQDPAKPFQPFGPQPKAGSNLYIGSQEVFQKKLTELTIQLSLEKFPPYTNDWLDIYAAYDTAHNDETSYALDSENFKPGKLIVQALYEKTWQPTTDKAPSFDLFNQEKQIVLTSELSGLKLDSFADTESVETWTPQSKNGFLRLRLADGLPRSDFLHDEYPRVLVRQMLAAATNQYTWVGGAQKKKAVMGAFYQQGTNYKKAEDYYVELTDEAVIPKEPYLPVLQSLYLSYAAKATKEHCQVFQLAPFDGFVRWGSQHPEFLPQFTHEGELLIGLQNLDPPTALPVFFQVAEETADAELEKATVHWSYLKPKENTWYSLSDRIVSDTTNRLIRSGIVTLAIPADIISKSKSTLLDPNLYWIKASVSKNSGAICQIISVHTQAAQVTFVDQDNDPSHLATPLDAGTIAKLLVPQAAIKKVEQPYASFGGQVKERPAHFYTRISEYLRHKGRAITIFDYERLVLEKFPDIYKVRCINHGQVVNNAQWQELVPGSVTLVVIPDLSQRSTTQDLQPKVNLSRLEEIEQYLAGKQDQSGKPVLVSLSSAWATIKVVNPDYEQIQVQCQVAFKPPYEVNFNYYKRQLDQDITRFLAPWTSNSAAEISFGGKLYRSSILNFVENLDYVDYVVDFKMYNNTNSLGSRTDVREAIASTPRSILTSVAPDPTTGQGHLITQVSDTPPARQPSLYPGTLGYTALEELTLE